MSEHEPRRVNKATSADIEAARAVDRLLQKLIAILDDEGPEEVLEVLLQHVRAHDPEEGA